MPLKHREHVDPVICHPIDDTVSALEHFTNVVTSDLWNSASSEGKLCRVLCNAHHLGDPALGGDGIIAGNETADGLEVVACPLGP
mgnify:CR=1 FL=1